MKLPLLLFIICYAASSWAGLLEQMRSLETRYKSRIGVSAVYVESGEQFHYRGNEWFKLASTNKVPIAVAVLRKVEQGELDLDEMIEIQVSDIVPGSGVMGYFFSRPGLSISVYNLLESMLAISDNSSTDTLLRRIGGVGEVKKMLQQHQIQDISINRSILDMYLDIEAINPRPQAGEFNIRNWVQMKASSGKESRSQSYAEYYSGRQDATTPQAMTMLLRRIYDGTILSPEYSHLLFDIMTHTLPSSVRLGKKLPVSVKVAHKTGTWWDKDPVSKKPYRYTNDIGMIVTETGRHILISVYVDSIQKVTKSQQIDAIAEVSKLVYNKFTRNN